MGTCLPPTFTAQLRRQSPPLKAHAYSPRPPPLPLQWATQLTVFLCTFHPRRSSGPAASQLLGSGHGLCLRRHFLKPCLLKSYSVLPIPLAAWDTGDFLRTVQMVQKEEGHRTTQRTQISEVQIPLLFAGCTTLSKLLNLSGSQIPQS